MADYDLVKERISSSVFEKRIGEHYLAHLKIWEIENGNDKARYIILSATDDGRGLLHKSRLNPNGTFSVGKTWNLNELRAIDVTAPSEVHASFARTYVWQTENTRDQDHFLNALVKLYRDTLGSSGSLRTSGFAITMDAPQARQPARTNGNDLRSVRSQATIRDPRPNGSSERTASPIPRGQTRTPVTNGRPVSPAGSSRSPRNMSPAPMSTRPSSPALSAGAATRKSRRPSNASSSVRSESSTRSQVPSIVVPPTPPASLQPGRPKESSPLRSKPIQVQAESFSASRSSLDVPSLPNPIPIASPVSDTVSRGSNGSISATPSPISPYPSNDDYNMRPTGRSNTRTPSPAPSNSSRRSQKSRVAASSPEPPMPSQAQQRTKIGQPPLPSSTQQAPRRDPNARISFFDPVNQALLDRLLFTASASQTAPSSSRSISKADGLDDGETEDVEWTEEGDSAAAMLANIEEMLEGYEWIGEGLSSRGRKGLTDQLDSRLLDELLLLEKANIHSLLESDDDRISKVMKGLDEVLTELDGMESTLSSYKIHLNAVADDILYIQSQNRGLQVQTQNQKALLNELEKLLQTVHVDRETLLTLTQESLEKNTSIQRLEEAASELYKALLAGRDNDMAATMERLEEYRTHNSQFCKRILDFLTIMFTAQANLLLGKNDGVVSHGEKGRLVIVNHQQIEAYLGRYCGLMLYLKEMDENRYSKVCAAYFSAASDLHSKQVKALCASYSNFVKQATEEESEQAFVTTAAGANWASGGLRRAGTVVRSPLDGRKEKGKQQTGTLRPFEVLDIILEQIAPQVYREEEFIADFLQINDAALTFADYMGLEHYFRRQAAQYAGLSAATMKLVRGALDLIFGFLPTEVKYFIDSALAKDPTQITGVVASIERAIADAEERGNVFFVGILEKQHQRAKTVFDRHVDEQIKAIEQTKLNAKKRRGVAHFIKYFPVYVSRIENQLGGADGLEIRGNVDAAYDRIVQAMFDCLKQMAKMDGEQGEDKGQLNYHVILIENMQHFISEVSQSKIVPMTNFRKRAEAIYEENLNSYVKIVVRRPFSKIIDFFEGVERLLKTNAPSEIAKNNSFNRSALKRVVKEYNSKDIKKLIDALFKRVEKHFTDENAGESNGAARAGVALAGVWKVCEEEILRITDLFSKRIGQCYVGAGVSLEYSRLDVESAFKRHRV